MEIGEMRIRKTAISYHTLPSGLRLVHHHAGGSAVEYCGVAVRVGSRDETGDDFGLAHFVEHTIFKGTSRRSPWHIINRMEGVGGELNAFTTKEETVVYSAFPAGNLDRALDLIGDLVKCSRFPDRELDKEREVVADEINSYLDSPDDAVFDDFEDLMFAGGSLGHNILGSAGALETFDSEKCRDYLRRWYVAGNMVAFYSGGSSPSRVFMKMEKYLGDIPDAECPRHWLEADRLVTTERFDLVRKIGSHQSHTVIGAEIPGMFSKERHAMALLSNILGGPGMNSLLNVVLRERKGLVYTVDASMSMFTDRGTMSIYFGCDRCDTAKCTGLVKNQIMDLAESKMSERFIERAKKQYLGQLIVAGENRESFVLAMARSTLFHGRSATVAETIEGIRAVTSQELLDAAGLLVGSSRLTLE